MNASLSTCTSHNVVKLCSVCSIFMPCTIRKKIHSCHFLPCSIRQRMPQFVSNHYVTMCPDKPWYWSALWLKSLLLPLTSYSHRLLLIHIEPIEWSHCLCSDWSPTLLICLLCLGIFSHGIEISPCFAHVRNILSVQLFSFTVSIWGKCLGIRWGLLLRTSWILLLTSLTFNINCGCVTLFGPLLTSLM